MSVNERLAVAERFVQNPDTRSWIRHRAEIFDAVLDGVCSQLHPLDRKRMSYATLTAFLHKFKASLCA